MARQTRPTRPFGTADHRVDTAENDAELVLVLDRLADAFWIPCPHYIGEGRWKVTSWRSYPGPYNKKAAP